MSSDQPTFQAVMSATPGHAEPVKGQIARFDLADGRRVDIHVPRAVFGEVKPYDVEGFRVVVRQPDGTASVELSAMDLVDVFGAQSAAQAIVAFTAGNLPRARYLARKAGTPWRGLRRLLREVSRRRSADSDPR